MSNVNMLIDSPYATSLFDGNRYVFPNCHHFRDLFSQNLHDLDLQNGQWSNVNIPIKRSHRIFHVLAIAMLAPSVTIYKIFTCKLLNIWGSNLWHWKWSSNMLTILLKTNSQTYFVNMHMLALLGLAVCTQWHFVAYVHTDRWMHDTHTLNAS